MVPRKSPEKKHTPAAVSKLHCSECGATAKASCACGVSYLPAGEFAAKVVAKNPEMSNGAIAEKFGVSEATIRRARNSVTSNDATEKRTGKDGKKYKARHKGAATEEPDQFERHTKDWCKQILE